VEQPNAGRPRRRRRERHRELGVREVDALAHGEAREGALVDDATERLERAAVETWSHDGEIHADLHGASVPPNSPGWSHGTRARRHPGGRRSTWAAMTTPGYARRARSGETRPTATGSMRA